MCRASYPHTLTVRRSANGRSQAYQRRRFFKKGWWVESSCAELKGGGDDEVILSLAEFKEVRTEEGEEIIDIGKKRREWEG